MSNNLKITENDIRPKDLIANQQIAMAQDIGRLLTKSDEFINVNCPACDKNDSFKKYTKYALCIQECNHCGTLYTNPRPTSEVLDWFYKGSVNYDYWNKFIFPASEDARRKKIFVPRVDKVLEYCEKYNVATNSLLEIGCAFGTFCVEIKSRNKFSRVVGVEPTPGLAQTSRDKGIEVIEEVIENINFSEEEKFDIVVNFEVIEHIFSPKDLITQSKKLLKKGGIFIVTCPNGKGFDFEVLGEKCNSVDHEHLNYFNPRSLSLLLENCGFEVLECVTPGKLDAELVRNKVLDKEFDLQNQPFLQSILIDNWETQGEAFQEYLVSQGMSSNLWIIAKNI